jgi:hypothetical protein
MEASIKKDTKESGEEDMEEEEEDDTMVGEEYHLPALTLAR